MEKIRIGLIGCGRFGQCHAEVIAGSSYAELVAVAVQSDTSRSRIQSRFDVPVTTDYRELLTRKDVDAVDIVLPSDLHERVTIDALRSGKHVFVEKPMAITAKQCDRMLSEAAKGSLSVCVNFELRMSPLWGRIKQDILHGVIGEPLSGSFDLWRFAFRPGSGNWRFTEQRVGSWLHEEPIHFLDLAAWAGDIESDEKAKFNYYVVENGEYRRARILEKSSEYLDLDRNIEAFCLHLHGRDTEIARGEDGRRSVALVEAALQSAHSGRPARLQL